LASPRYAEASTAAGALQRLDATIAEHRAHGGRVFLTRGAVGFVGTMATNEPTSGFVSLLAHLQSRYRLQLAATESFGSYELLPLD
jgi:hypothetical protein